MRDHLGDDDPEANDGHHVGHHDEIGLCVEPVRHPEDRTCKSLHLGWGRNSLDGIASDHAIRLRNRADERERDAHQAEHVA